MSRDPFYRSKEWRLLRASALVRDGGRCTVKGCGARATHVDHIVSRRKGGLDALPNLRSLCATHDNQAKEDAQGNRRRGGKMVVVGCDADGWPLDPSHEWNRGNE